MTKENEAILKERRKRWAEYRRTQLGATITLATSLSSAGLAFCASLLTTDHAKFGEHSTPCYLFTIGLFVAAVTCGVSSTFTRLLDFRLTSKTVDLLESIGESSRRVMLYRFLTHYLGGISWSLVWIQLVLLCGGVLSLAHTLYTLFYNTLYP